jgi:hypothetical protein
VDCHNTSGFPDLHAMTNLSGIVTIMFPTDPLLRHASLRLC